MEFYGLFGYPLGHSLSPEIHQIIYEEAQIEAAYKLFEVPEESLSQALEALKTLDIRGANVTIPYKQALFPYLDELSETAKKLDAVNTIKQVDGKLKAYNTDYDGIHLSFERRHWQTQGKAAYVLGTGGAAQAMGHYLTDHGAQVHLVSRHPDQHQDKPWPCLSYAELEILRGDFLVNCTPVGMYPKTQASPLEAHDLDRFDHIFDTIYNPYESQLLSDAKAAGKAYCNGLDMLVGQAIRSVEIWEDQHFSKDQVERILARVKKGFNHDPA
ncbi:shikimate dehydrogenase [Aerococcus sanguinicola]|uniref:Shikimate dehydrogenase (NADP(+)) n=1 Tax=Aerococcus sanguinicola TaxID=119206 RepID=A0A0X8FCK1_9LACT|nr:MULTISPECIES: shikimate dehydrogenase [Aerococcus]AMB94770.1 hypothetical protein AWM72_08370 [Aerococcus sanguinicola]MDK7049539.1 shikimate dehydrogenase [Aerococcus sanguinicola]OFT96315.1 hypothetical protein HMPREF3090_02700 [Aerococcus sp. HMSC23C02]PKZ23229.1 shikimate dehydrogenase [Aerococcus sanguinicola]